MLESNHPPCSVRVQVAHDAVRQASIKDGADYLSSGFVARSREEELTGADYEVVGAKEGGVLVLVLVLLIC